MLFKCGVARRLPGRLLSFLLVFLVFPRIFPEYVFVLKKDFSQKLMRTRAHTHTQLAHLETAPEVDGPK